MRYNKLNYFLVIALVWCSGYSFRCAAQGMHFSQYYNAPLLLNPANAALMPDNDYRIGVNYRQQWSAIPVPFATASAYGDFQLLRNKNETNWLGIGFAFFNDRTGDGNLSLFQSEIALAYHIQIGSYNMISFGVSASSVQRKVDFNKLSYDIQWNGFIYDRDQPNYEGKGVEKTSYAAVNAGLNYAFFPNEFLYVKVGAGLANINQPKESFMNFDNKLEYRPTGNLDVKFRSNSNLIINPSAYYSTQSGSYELVYGSLFSYAVGNMDELDANTPAPYQFIAGGFHRMNDAVIGVVGFSYNNLNIIASYDYTISKLALSATGAGSFEISLKYEGLYNESSKGRRTYHCPRL